MGNKHGFFTWLCPKLYNQWASALSMWTAGRFGGFVEGVPRCHGYFHSGGLAVRAGRAAEEFINLEGRDWVIGALCWGGHCWDGSGVPVVIAGGNG